MFRRADALRCTYFAVRAEVFHIDLSEPKVTTGEGVMILGEFASCAVTIIVRIQWDPFPNLWPSIPGIGLCSVFFIIMRLDFPMTDGVVTSALIANSLCVRSGLTHSE